MPVLLCKQQPRMPAVFGAEDIKEPVATLGNE